MKSPLLDRSIWIIVIAVAVMLSLAMGLRQSLGIFMPSLTRDLDISVANFTLAIAVQNLAWGILQPFTGALAGRHGFRGLMVAGAIAYVAGLILMATAGGAVAVWLGAGVLVGASMACTGTAIAFAVGARSASPATRGTVLGIVGAAGSIGAMIAAPIGQAIMQSFNWRWGVAAFALLALIMIPAAWIAGRVDTVPLPSTAREKVSASAALKTAFANAPFVVMSIAYFVCGMQLVFLSTHLPAYLEICGMDPMLSAKALGMIGAFNVVGSLFFGWAGDRWNKLLLLGGIYVTRSLALAWYFHSNPTPESTLVFAAIMGFLWLGVGPLVSGWLVETFGLRWQALLGGVAFFSHQIGSFVGAFGGGLLYDALGNYTTAWQIGVGLGLAAGIVQMLFAVRPTRPPSRGMAGA